MGHVIMLLSSDFQVATFRIRVGISSTALQYNFTSLKSDGDIL